MSLPRNPKYNKYAQHLQTYADQQDEMNAGTPSKKRKREVPPKSTASTFTVRPAPGGSAPAPPKLSAETLKTAASAGEGGCNADVPQTPAQTRTTQTGSSAQAESSAQTKTPQAGPSARARTPQAGPSAQARSPARAGSPTQAKSSTKTGSSARPAPAPAPPDAEGGQDANMPDQSDSDDELEGETPGETAYLKRLKDIYSKQSDKATQQALLAVLEELSREAKADRRGKKRGKRAADSGIPWNQDDDYCCTDGPRRREKQRVALSGYIRLILSQLLKLKDNKTPLPGGPPPEVAAPTAAAFYIKWDESEKSEFNAIAARIVALQVFKDYPSICEVDQIHEMATCHVKYLRARYRRQTIPEYITKEARRLLSSSAGTRKRTLYGHRLRIINAIPALARHGRLIETLGLEGTSSDEEDLTRGRGIYVVKRPVQLSQQVTDLKRQLDLAHYNRFKGPGSKGNQVRRRIDVPGVESRRKLRIPGLPISCMDPGWLATLTDVQKSLYEFRDLHLCWAPTRRPALDFKTHIAVRITSILAMRIIWLLTLFYLVLGSAASVRDSPDYGTVIGIDLGTTYSCVGIYQGDRVDIVPNEQGNRITPSWVGFTDNERLIGDTAKQAFHSIPSQTVFAAKRLLGRHYDDDQLHEDIRHWPFKVVNRNGRPAVEIIFRGSPKIFTPQEISAMVLRKLKENAEAYLGHQVTHAVVTVPAYFNDEQRQATKDAGKIAGLEILRMINEPTAAAIAYGLDKKGGKESRIVVYDLGGGTFDVSLLQANDGIFKVLATAGDTHLGGEDFDNRVIDYFAAKYYQNTKTNILKNRRALSKLKREVEKAKQTLSSQVTARLEIESLEGGNDFSATLTRAKFEELNLDLFKRTLGPVTRVLGDSGLSPSNVDDVILVGGSTRIPIVRQLLKDYFKGLEPRMGINPDEAVAYGAAVQGSILARMTPDDDMDPIDVCSFTLGIKTTGGAFNQLVARNTPIPVQKSELFSTATDNQRTVLIEVLQEDPNLAEPLGPYVPLGTFRLTGIPPSVRGVPQIQVTFDIDANGLLTVVAYDKDSGNSEAITITREKYQLAKSDIDRMVHEAEMFSQNDQEGRARLAALHELQAQIAIKRAELNPHAGTQAPAAQALLTEHSHWADTSGELASIFELSSRIEEVREITADREALVATHDEVSYSPPASLPDVPPVLDVIIAPSESLESPPVPVSTSALMVPIFRAEL
ncbi:ATPase with role in protein import into the ER [Ceratobasidium sp. 395]|nr:ATPase with role in protein import into the ER [Ceratobasidium sp. 395]